MIGDEVSQKREAATKVRLAVVDSACFCFEGSGEQIEKYVNGYTRVVFVALQNPPE